MKRKLHTHLSDGSEIIKGSYILWDAVIRYSNTLRSPPNVALLSTEKKTAHNKTSEK